MLVLFVKCWSVSGMLENACHTWAPYRCDHDKAQYKSTFTFTLPYLYCLFVDSSWTGPCSRVHSLILGHKISLCCWTSLPHMESCHCRWNVMEEVNRTNGSHWLAVARPVRTPRMV